MADVAAVTDLLAQASVEQPLAEVSFAGQGLKLDSADDGKKTSDGDKIKICTRASLGLSLANTVPSGTVTLILGLG